MSSVNSTIPRSIKAIYLYLVQTCAYLVQGTPTNAVRFNWTAANLTAWQNFLSQFTPLYLQYSNRKAGYTTDIKDQLQAIIANLVLYARTNKLIELIKATVSLNTTDCSTFNLPAKYAVPSTSTHSIAKSKELDKTIFTFEAIYPRLIPEAGGYLHIKAYSEKTQSGRPHKLKGFDELGYAIAVFYSTAVNLPNEPNDARLTKDYSTKANFGLQTSAMTANLTSIATGSATPTKIAVLFFRWAKSRHPASDGPWNGPFTTPLL
jgi:hypothetical protein